MTCTNEVVVSFARFVRRIVLKVVLDHSFAQGLHQYALLFSNRIAVLSKLIGVASQYEGSPQSIDVNGPRNRCSVASHGGNDRVGVTMMG